MIASRTLRYCKFIIAYLLSLFVAFFYPLISFAQTQEEENYVEVSSFDEFTSSLSQMQSTGGTIVLTQDITVPAEASYTYNNGRYRKEVVIETGGHTIYVEGYLNFWPFLTIRGDGSQKELIHVYPGGELHLVSICLDAGENGIAIVQEEGSFLTYTSEESMGLPAFSCIGQIISSQTMTAAAYWRYNCEKLPIIRVPAGADFTADMLPSKVLSIVSRDHQEYEEEVPVVWDETTFPTEHKRTLVRGTFADGYSQYEDYVPQCLVIWESDTSPFFLNVYLKSATQWYDMVFMYGESPQQGTICIQSSDDGETWTEITGTDGYSPVAAEENDGFVWILSYDRSEPTEERPQYYRLLQILDNGTELYSDALELSDTFIFTAADIEGGRGGETSPNEGENQLPNEGIGSEESEQSPSLGSSDTSQEQQPDDTESQESEQTVNKVERPEGHSIDESAEETSGPHVTPTPDSTSSLPDNNSTGVQMEEGEETAPESDAAEESEPVKSDSEQADDTNSAERVIGIAIVICILAGSVIFSVVKRKK